MNRDTCLMLEKIVFSDNLRMSSEDLVNLFSVGERTILNYWKELKVYLETAGFSQTVSFNGKEFIWNGKNNDVSALGKKTCGMNFYDYRLNSEELWNLVALTLAYQSEPVKIDDLQKLTLTSRSTSINDLNTVRAELRAKKISMSVSTKAGASLKCTETVRRKLIMKACEHLRVVNLYYLEDLAFTPIVPLVLNLLHISKYFMSAKYAIEKCEAEFKFTLRDNEFYKLLFVVCIIARRREMNCSVHEKYSYEEKDIVLANTIFRHMGIFFKDNNETYYLAGWIKEIGISGIELISKTSEIYIETIVQSLLSRMSDFYQQDLSQDKMLNEYLLAHVLSCYHRAKKKELLDNPFLKDMKNAYPKDFNELKNNIYILENSMNIRLSDDEIAYILMHIRASVERQNISTYNPRIIVTCNSGMGTGNLLATLLQKNFGIEVLEVCSVHNLDKALQDSKPDLIVSTVPIAVNDTPYKIVNAVPAENNLEDLQNIFASIRSQKMQKPHYTALDAADHTISLFNLFNADNIRLDSEVESWEEAIISAGELMLWQKKISVNYLNKMIDLVHQYGPYIVIGPGIALAHAAPEDGCLSPGVSLVRLKKPVRFGSSQFDPVTFVFGVAAPDSPAYAVAMLDFMNQIRDPTFIDHLKSAANIGKILAVIQNL